jgi:hypothetical protein
MANMVSKLVENLHILVHTDKPPSDEEWQDYLRTFGKVPPERLRTIVFTLGGGPSAAQRKLLNDKLNGKATPAAVVSTSAVVRGIVTALAWFNKDIKAFAPDQTEAAFEYLGFDVHQTARFMLEVRSLRTKLNASQMRGAPKL